jgi:hypothetical protein
MKEFVINKFLKIKLEDGRTIIYVNDEQFKQCKFLFLNIKVDDLVLLEEIDSIDEAAEVLDRSAEGRDQRSLNITPKEEFWGHCSNLQVWYEHNYDTRLLHRSLSFSLLKKLSDAGDPLAQQVFSEEIAKRFNEGTDSVQNFLMVEGYLDYINDDYFWSLFDLDTSPLQDLEAIMDKKIRYWLFCTANSFSPAFVFKGNEIICLNLCNCNLELLPESIGDLKYLKCLYLRHNQLKILPQSISKLQKLEILHLSNNSFEVFPKMVNLLKALKVLVLSNNDLKEIPEEIANLENLEILHLHNNPISSVPKSIKNLKHLKQIMIHKKSQKKTKEDDSFITFGKLFS